MELINQHYPFKNPPLPYGYSDLEPHIDSKTMHLHHDKHLQGFVDNLNATIKDYPELHDWSLEQLIYNADRLPEKIQTPVKRNGGGMYNHILYFNGMAKNSRLMQESRLNSAISKEFGSVKQFLAEFKKQALSVFGSGYAWLVLNKHGKLEIITLQNQDTPITQDLYPLMTIDVWEHAYYLKNYNDRAAYIDNWISVINWQQAERMLMKFLRR